MVESMIGLLRQDQSLTQATRCDEGFPSDSQFPVLPSITSPNLLSPMFLPHYLSPVTPSLAILFSLEPLARLSVYVIRIFHWLLLAAKEAKTSSVCET